MMDDDAMSSGLRFNISFSDNPIYFDWCLVVLLVGGGGMED